MVDRRHLGNRKTALVYFVITQPHITQLHNFDKKEQVLKLKTAVYHSHARTVVQECCKGDDESQWERGKFDPPPPKNSLTDGHQNLCR